MVPQPHEEDETRTVEDKLNSLVVPITVRRLSYKDVDQLQEWENNALKTIEQIFGKDSSCYKDLYDAIQSGPSRYGQDPRGQVITAEQYQQEMDERTNRYQDIIGMCAKHAQ
jgi:hypothetical protein